MSFVCLDSVVFFEVGMFLSLSCSSLSKQLIDGGSVRFRSSSNFQNFSSCSLAILSVWLLFSLLCWTLFGLVLSMCFGLFTVGVRDLLVGHSCHFSVWDDLSSAVSLFPSLTMGVTFCGSDLSLDFEMAHVVLMFVCVWLDNFYFLSLNL